MSTPPDEGKNVYPTILTWRRYYTFPRYPFPERFADILFVGSMAPAAPSSPPFCWRESLATSDNNKDQAATRW